MHIKCDNDLCIYEKEKCCMLGSISMDSMGMCSQCIRINIDERVRDNAKLHMLAELEHKGLL